MQVARISMGEYKSSDALDQFIRDYSKNFWEIFPNASSASTVRTGGSSIINTTIYPDEDAAKVGLEKRLWVAFLTATVTPGLVFLLFDFVLKIRFPRGILMNLYYG